MTTELPLVSIVIPSYNQAQFLEEAILSVLNQDYPNIELIIIDGGSTDYSVDIIRKYADRIAYWVSEPDQGPVDAINKGLAKCNGGFLGVLPSDDALLPDAVSRKMAFFSAKPEVDFFYGDTEQIDSTGKRLFVRFGNNLPYREWVRTCTMPIAVHSSLWKRSVMQQVGFWDIARGVASDWDFFLRVGLKCKMEYLPGIAGKFRYHPSSDSATQQLQWVTLVPQMYEEYFSKNSLPKEIQVLKKEALANAHLYSTYILLDHAPLKATVKELMRALVAYPPILFSGRFGKLVLSIALGQRGRALCSIAKRRLKSTIMRKIRICMPPFLP